MNLIFPGKTRKSVAVKEIGMIEKIKRSARLVYLKLFRINDSPLKIALGFGLGVFLGIMPGAGPIAALVLAFLLRVNRASALLASILFNTWLSFLILILAVKAGSLVMRKNYRDIYAKWTAIFQDFSWGKLFDTSVYDVFLPIGIGYLLISLFFAGISSTIIFMLVRKIRNKKSQ